MFGRTGFVAVAVLAFAILLVPGRACRAQMYPGLPRHSTIEPDLSISRKLVVSAEDKAEAAILAALKKPVELEFVATPLGDVVEHCGKTLGVKVFIDQRALEDVGFSTAEPVTFRESGISGRAALCLILRDLDLTWTIRGNVLFITTPEEAESILQTKVYDVADLFGGQLDDPDFEALKDLIGIIQPTTWPEVGGPMLIPSLDADGIRALAFAQTRDVHEEVAALLAELRRVRDGKKAEKLSAEEAIERALAAPIDFEFVKTPLADVASFLRQKLKVPVRIDEKALEHVGINSKQPVSFRMSGVSAQLALDLMLGQHDLTWIARNEMLLITTSEEAETRLAVRVYDVADLVVTHDEYGVAHSNANPLIETIEMCGEEAGWDTRGGPGSIMPLELPGLDVLVISQTRQGHAGVRKLLADLRAVRRLPPPNKRATKRGPVPGQHGYPIHGGYDVPPQLDPGMPDSHKGGGFF